MGTKERRARERHETRTRILDAARDMFVKDGLEAVTMRNLAEKIEYTPTAIYHHFRDKQALLRELVAHDSRELAQAFQRIGKLEDPIERLRKLGLTYIKFGLEHPAHYRFLFMVAPPDKSEIEKGNPEEDAFAFLRQTVVDAIASGRLRPELKDPDRVALMCWSVVHGIVSLTIVFGDNPWFNWPDAERTGANALDALTRGILRDDG